jgi:hypothetical protein
VVFCCLGGDENLPFIDCCCFFSCGGAYPSLFVYSIAADDAVLFTSLVVSRVASSECAISYAAENDVGFLEMITSHMSPDSSPNNNCSINILSRYESYSQ